MTQKKQSYILPIIMMMLLFAMISFVTNLAAPIGMIWKERFADSSVLGMMGNMMNFLAYLCMGIPAGVLLSKIGYKKTALLAIIVGFVGVGIQFLSGFPTDTITSFVIYLLGAFVAGFSVCMLNTVVNPMLNTLGGGGNKGNQLVQTGGTLNSLAGTFTPMFVGALIGNVTKDSVISDVNPVLYVAMGLFALVFIVLSAVNIPEPHIVKVDPNAPKVKDKYSAWSFRHFVLGAIAIFIYVGVEVGIFGTLMMFLTGKSASGGMEYAADVAGTIAGTYLFLMMVGRFIGAAIGGKVSSKTMLATAAGVAILLVVIAIFYPVTELISMPTFTGSGFIMSQVPMSVLFLVLCGLCISIMWGGIFNLAVEGLGKYTAKASGIFMMMVVGGGVLPLIQNAIADWAGYMVSYWVIVAGLAYILYYAVIGSKNVSKHIPVE